MYCSAIFDHETNDFVSEYYVQEDDNSVRRPPFMMTLRLTVSLHGSDRMEKRSLM
jgi:hypothetical protein